MTTQVISSGVTTGFDVQSGDRLKVYSGGESSASVISSGAVEYVSSGGLSEADTISSKGYLTLYAGATADQLVVSSGGVVSAGSGVLTGQNYVAGKITSGMIGTVEDGESPLIYGSLEVASGGAVIGTEVVNGALYLDSGATATSVVLASSFEELDSMTVGFGAEAYGTLLSAGGTIDVYGVASGAVLESAEMDVSGSSLSTTLSGNSLETVYAGGLADADRVSSGSLIVLSSGATAEGVRVSSGGRVALAIEVHSGQYFSLQNGPLTAGVSLSGVAALSGAHLSAIDPVVDSGGVLVAQSGASLYDVTVSAGGRLSGGVITGGEYFFDPNTDAGFVSEATLVESLDAVANLEPGVLQVVAGGSSYRIDVGNGGLLEVESGGSATLTSVTGTSGLLQVDAGGLVSASVIGAAGGSAQSALILGSASYDTVSSGGFEAVASGGVASRSVVSSGGVQAVASGGSALITHVMSGGREVLAPGAYASGVVVSSGATAELSIALSAGQVYNLPPADGTSAVTLDGVEVLVGGELDFDQATLPTSARLGLKGHALSGGALIAAGADLIGSGVLLGETVDAGEVQDLTLGQAGLTGVDLQVVAGGEIRSVSVAGATIEVFSGGEAEYVTLGSGGSAEVSSGGHFVYGSVGSAALLVLQSGAVPTATVVSSGGTVEFLGARATSGTTLTAGPVAGASSVVSGVTVQAGGVTDYAQLTVSSGAQVALNAGGEVMDATILAGGVISGSGVLGGAAFNSGSVSAVALTGYLNDFARVVSVGVGSGASVDIEAGALAVSDRLAATGSQRVFSGGVVSGTIIVSGGSETIFAGGTARGVVVSSGGVEIASSGAVVSGGVVRAGGVEMLNGHATVQGLTVSSGGTVDMAVVVSSGQTLVVPAPGGAVTLDGVTVLSGGTLNLGYTTVRSGGTVSVASGVILSNANVQAGGRLVGGGSIESPIDPTDGQSEQFPSFVEGLVSGVTVGRVNYADLDVEVGGTAEAVTLDYGMITLSSGATATSTRLDSAGGYEVFDVAPGASETGAVLGRGVEQVIGVSTDATVQNGAIQKVYSPGLAVGAVVSGNGQQWLTSGATGSGTTVLSGGELLMDPGSIAVGARVSSGGALDIGEGGAAIASGQSLSAGTVSATAVIGGVTVSSGGAVIYDDLVVQSGAKITLGAQGALGDVTVQAGAVVSGSGILFDVIDIFGSIQGVTIGPDPFFKEDPDTVQIEYHHSSGVQLIHSGGSARQLQIVSGGYLEVQAGGALAGFVLSSGGQLYADFGAAAFSGRVLSGAFEEAGGPSLSGTVVSSGGELQYDGLVAVSSGQTVYQGVQTALASVGGASVSSGGVAHYGVVEVDSGGVLVVGAGQLTSLEFFYDSLTVSHGGLVSGVGALGGATEDAGVVSGVTVGNPLATKHFGTYGILEVLSGGLGKSVNVSLQGTVQVDSGGILSASVVSGAEIVSGGGSDIGGVVAAGGSATFQLGAIEQGVTVASGAQATLAATVSAGEVLSLGADLASTTEVVSGVSVQSGGNVTLAESVVSSGGVLALGAKAFAADTTISAGGTLTGGTVFSLPTGASATTVDGLLEDAKVSGVTQVMSGGVIRNLVFTGGELNLNPGALASGVQMAPGAYGAITVYGGAVLSNAVLEAGSSEGAAVEVYGSANGDTIDSGRTEAVSFGVDTDATVEAGGALVLGYAGTVDGATVQSGGLFYYDDEDGQAQGVTVASGGRVQYASFAYVDQGQTLVDGALVASTTSEGVALQAGAIVDYSGEVASGGTLSVTSVGEAQTIYVDAGGLVTGSGTLATGQNAGTIDGVTLLGALTDTGATSGVIIASGGADNLAGPGVATSGRILAGGTQTVLAGATVVGETISAGGEETVAGGGVVSGVKVLAGGSALISSGGVISSLTISSGGAATVQAVVSSGQTDTLAPPTASGSTSFGKIAVAAGAALTLQSAAVQSGGHLVLDAGATVAASTYEAMSGIYTFEVSAGVTVSSGGTLAGAGTIGGVLTVSSGGSASGVTVVLGGSDVIASGSVETNVSVAAGANLMAAGYVISSGQTLQDGAVTTAEIVGGASAASGSTVTLSGATVSSGGALQVLLQGSASDVATVAGAALVNSGAITYDQIGSTKLAGTLAGNGTLALAGSATVLVQSGSASAFDGTVVIGGAYNYNFNTGGYDSVSGTLELAKASGLGSGTVIFSGDSDRNTFATLQIDAPDTPANGSTFASQLENFGEYGVGGDALDLRGLAYVSGASATSTAGTLTLKDGSTTANFTLTGYSASSFTVAGDGHGGTLVTPTAASGSDALRQAAATFDTSASPGAPSIKTCGAQHLLPALEFMARAEPRPGGQMHFALA